MRSIMSGNKIYLRLALSRQTQPEGSQDGTNGVCHNKGHLLRGGPYNELIRSSPFLRTGFNIQANQQHKQCTEAKQNLSPSVSCI